MSQPLAHPGAEPNPNETTYDYQYRRRLRMPIRLNFEQQSKLAMFRRLADHLPTLPEGARVLDLGFGLGKMLLWFPKHCELGGNDLSLFAVEQMRQEAGRRGYRAFRFERLNLDREPIPWVDGSAEVVVCSHLIEHVADDRQLLEMIRRALRPGGHLILMCPINETDRNANPLHVRRYTEESLEKLLEDFGFQVIATDKADTIYHVFEWIGWPRLPRPLEVLRGKCIAVLGAIAVLIPPIWSLPIWGVPRDYGVLARLERRPEEHL